MAEGVTYADLRFAKSPAEKGRTPGEAPPEECSDGEGELTYENFPAAPRRRQPADPGPQPPGMVPGRVQSLVPLALLGACLFLLATCLGLGLRYWQVSVQLEGASRRHSAESGALAQRLGGQEENLTQTLRLLSRAQAELSATSLALRQSREATNRTRRQLDGERERLEEERKRWELAKSGLQEEKAQAVRELAAAKKVLDRGASCQPMDCCPLGWKPFHQKCLWISSGEKTWRESKEDCESEGARLLILDPWDAGNFWQSAAIMGHLRSGEFWIGLHWTKGDWCWVDGTRYTGTRELDPNDGTCAKVSQRILKEEKCYYQRRYVCEKAATPFSWLCPVAVLITLPTGVTMAQIKHVSD